MNWMNVAAVMAVLYLGVFVWGLAGRRFSWSGLLVALAHLPLAFMVSVAPIRGWADPDYLGFVFGFIQVPAGPGVTVVAGVIFALAVTSIALALRGRGGAMFRLLSLFDAFIALNLGASTLWAFFQKPESLFIQLGEYLYLGPVAAVIIDLGVLTVPMALCAAWFWRRATVANHATIGSPTSA